MIFLFSCVVEMGFHKRYQAKMKLVSLFKVKAVCVCSGNMLIVYVMNYTCGYCVLRRTYFIYSKNHLIFTSLWKNELSSEKNFEVFFCDAE